jgi:hypothetical protein
VVEKGDRRRSSSEADLVGPMEIKASDEGVKSKGDGEEQSRRQGDISWKSTRPSVSR